MSQSLSPLCRYAVQRQLPDSQSDNAETAPKIKKQSPPPRDVLSSYAQERDLHPSMITFRTVEQANPIIANQTDQ
ncbi:MAG: hypothetical protein KF898_08330 [Parachlamydiales bacterium]|nr:hypothetical protein [Verrucomicrobiota bacterium]MBX3719638.1 hypothetical protein [Candidatus Acheromyda pituitae]